MGSEDTIMVLLPDGSIKLYVNPFLRAADVLKEFPRYELLVGAKLEFGTSSGRFRAAVHPTQHLIPGELYYLTELPTPAPQPLQLPPTSPTSAFSFSSSSCSRSSSSSGLVSLLPSPHHEKYVAKNTSPMASSWMEKPPAGAARPTHRKPGSAPGSGAFEIREPNARDLAGSRNLADELNRLDLEYQTPYEMDLASCEVVRPKQAGQQQEVSASEKKSFLRTLSKVPFGRKKKVDGYESSPGLFLTDVRMAKPSPCDAFGRSLSGQRKGAALVLA